MLRKITAFIMVLSLALTFCGCTTLKYFLDVYGNEQDDDTVKIGIFEPLTGIDGEAAGPELSGIMLAHELYPTLFGKKVELIYADNHSNPEHAVVAAKELIDEQVAIVIGSCGNILSMAGGELFQKAGIPAIAVTCTNPLVTVGNPYYFRMSTVDAFQGLMVARYVYNNLGENRAAVIKKKGNDCGIALTESFKAEFTALTGDDKALACVVEYEEAEDVRKQLKTISAEGVSAIYLTSDGDDAILILKQAKKMGINAAFIGTESVFDEDFLKKGEEAAEGLIFPLPNAVMFSRSELQEEFLSEYRSIYEEDFSVVNSMALGYDAYLLALDALKRQRETGGGKSLKDVLKDTDEFRGATGTLRFDGNGDPVRSVPFIIIKDGEFVYSCTIGE